MSSRFEFATATRIVFGRAVAAEVAPLAASWGRRALVVTGGQGARARGLVEQLGAAGLTVTQVPVAAEPSTSTVLEATAAARHARCDVVVGVGGGSVLDVGKAVAALLTNPGEPLDYLEVVGRGQPLTERSAPYVAVPTTAGTGAEVTRNAVLYSEEHRVKVSLRSPLMLPSAAVVDPELTYDLPPPVTASTGLDALTQVLEPFVCRRANPLTDALCREGLVRGARSLRRAYANGLDPEARQDMALVSLLGGLALANAGLGAVHGLAGPLGGLLGAPHGAVCAALLAPVMAANVAALEARDPSSAALRRYDEVAQLLTGRTDASRADGVAWVAELCRELGVQPLSQLGLRAESRAPIVAASVRASSMKPNPVELTEQELDQVLRAAG